MNLVIARITPFKNIFFTTGHSLFFACVLSLILKAHNFSDYYLASSPQHCLNYVSPSCVRLQEVMQLLLAILIWLAMHCLVILASYLVNIKTAQPKTSLAEWQIGRSFPRQLEPLRHLFPNYLEQTAIPPLQ